MSSRGAPGIKTMSSRVSTVPMEASSKFGITREELSDPPPGAKFHPVFDFRNQKEWKSEAWDKYGGIQGILKAIQTDAANGLDDGPGNDFDERVQVFGDNHRIASPPLGYFELIWEGLKDPTLRILIAAAAVSIALGVAFEGANGWHEGVAIMFAVALVVNVGAYNDLQKDKKFRELEKANAARKVLVVRGSVSREVVIDELLVGDVVKMTDGDIVPADGLLLAGNNVLMDESAITGESDQLKKTPEKNPFLISGTSVSSGELTMVVVGVGTGSEQGRMFDKIREAQEIEKKKPTPLQRKLHRLAELISYLGGAIGILVFFVMLITHLVEWSEGRGTVNDDGERTWASSNYVDILGFFIVAITVLVVAIPEGLPLAVTISLAYSVKKMQKENILVRTLDACEIMGNATAICTDKTGTLTLNLMKVMQMWSEVDAEDAADGFHMEQNNQGKREEIEKFYQKTASALGNKMLMLCVQNSILNSTAEIVPLEDATTLEVVIDPATGKPMTKVSGNKTEGALLYWAIGHSKQDDVISETRRSAEERGSVVQKYPFSSKRKRMSTLVQSPEGNRYILHVKGAAEMVLRLCTHIIDAHQNRVPLTGDFTLMSDGRVEGSGRKAQIVQGVINAMAKKALRCIALAYREFGPEVLEMQDEMIEYPSDASRGTGLCPVVEDDLTLIGIVGIMDPVRPEVPEAVGKCQSAGVKVRMVTGDNTVTARAIAEICHILTPETGGTSIEGPEFHRRVHPKSPYREPDFQEKEMPKLQVMARSAPLDKLLMVEGLRQAGEVVAVTGDGSNDAPALSKANIGFAMGIAGTEVAKKAAKIVLLDDNFASIVNAVKWGRNVYDSIRKFLQFQLTVNLTALMVAFVGAVSLKESPLTATQLLWVNLIMDSFASLALATEPPTDDLLKRKPYSQSESLISPFMVRNILAQFFYQSIVLVTLIFEGDQIFEIPTGRQLGHAADPTQHYTIVFHAFVVMQLFNEVSSRKCNGEINILEGIERNWLFSSILVGTLVIQYILVQFAGDFAQVTPLTIAQHGACILLGLGGIGVALLVHLIPVDWMPKMPESRPEEFEQEESEKDADVGDEKSEDRSITSPHEPMLPNGVATVALEEKEHV